MLLMLARRAAVSSRTAVPAFLSAYPTRKTWPPDFRRLTPQEQLRLEKKYKRRILLANRRPRFDKAIKLAQLVTVVVILGWLFFFSEFEFWGKQYKPSQEIRENLRHLFGALDPETRYERRPDAPPPPNETSKPESKSS